MLHFIVNNREVKTELPAGSSLVDYLRDELHLYGTKIGCREGDCGACTILVGEMVNGQLTYQTMASCLMPLGNAHHRHIVTVEGINGEELTPIQVEMVQNNAIQCGFCTPGFVLSLYGFCLNQKTKTMEHALEALAGNICRCTGYKSIEKAAAALTNRLASMPLGIDQQIQWLQANRYLPDYFATIGPRLTALTQQSQSIQVQASGLIVAGGTDLLLQAPDEAREQPVNLVFGAKEFRQIKIEADRCWIGAATTVTELKESPQMRTIVPKLPQYLELMASTPIRNMATVAGNIANASPIGDLAVIFLALDAKLILNCHGQERELALKDFFLGHKKTALATDEIIQWIVFDRPTEVSRLSFEKVSKRVHLDMATVNSAMQVHLENGMIKRATFAIGGVGPNLLCLNKTCQYLIGKTICNETFKQANKIAQTEITPRSRADYKRALLRQQLFIHLRNFAPADALTLEALR